MLWRLHRRWTSRLTEIRTNADRGVETVDKALWMGVVIVVVGAVGALFRDAVIEFFNSLIFEIGFGAEE